MNNRAYIDGSNLHNGVKQLGWDFDYARFRVWLSEKYSVGQAYMFLGWMPKYNELYNYLRRCGYILVFKEVIYDRGGKAKGNCDADVVVHAMRDSYENKFDKAVLVSSDGDYTPLVTFLIGKGKMEVVVSTHERKKCSVLLRRTDVKIVYITDKQSILQKEKAPDEDETS